LQAEDTAPEEFLERLMATHIEWLSVLGQRTDEQAIGGILIEQTIDVLRQNETDMFLVQPAEWGIWWFSHEQPPASCGSR
jgi:hypothetical protein